MFGDGSSMLGTNGFFLAGVDNSPAAGEAYQGGFLISQLDGRTALREVLLSACVCCDGGDHCFGLCGRAHQVFLVNDLQFRVRRHQLSRPRALGPGRRLVGRNGFSRFRRLHGGSFRQEAGRGWPELSFSAPRLGKYTSDGRMQPMPRPQYAASYTGRVYLMARLVRF